MGRVTQVDLCQLETRVIQSTMTKQIKMQIKWHSFKFKFWLLEYVNKHKYKPCEKVSVKMRQLFVYVYGFLKTSNNKALIFTQNNSWSKIIFKLEGQEKMISEFLSVSVFSYSNKTNLLSCSNGAFFEMMLIRGLVFFLSK